MSALLKVDGAIPVTGDASPKDGDRGAFLLQCFSREESGNLTDSFRLFEAYSGTECREKGYKQLLVGPTHNLRCSDGLWSVSGVVDIDGRYRSELKFFGRPICIADIGLQMQRA